VICLRAALGVVDAELEPDDIGAVTLGVLTPEVDEAEFVESEVEADDDGVKLAKDKLVDLEAAAQNCSTSASADATSDGHAVRQPRKDVV